MAKMRSDRPGATAAATAAAAASSARLLAAARRAASRAHAPYSGFRVGCALLDASGQVFIGANVENASYPLGICAERNALLAWRAAAGDHITDLIVFTPTDRPTPPCGLCRDALRAWAPGARLYLAGLEHVAGPFDPDELLPR